MQKKEIEAFLKELEVDDLVQNLQVMGNEVILDMQSHSPAMHEKVKLEKALKAAFQQKYGEAVKLKLNLSNPPSKEQNLNRVPELKGVSNVVAIASGKGGVGKSTVSANLAVTLAKMGFKVGLLDADIYGPSQPTMFDVEFEKPKSIEKEGKKMMQPIESHGVKLLSIGFFAGANQAVIWRGPMASKALQQMIHDADWGELDFLLIDLPPGTGDIHLSLVQQLPITGAVIVSTPQSVATVDARKAVAMFQTESINIPTLGMIENMSFFTPEDDSSKKYYIFGQDGVKQLSEQLNVPFLGEIPISQNIREAADVGNPVVLQENSDAQKQYEEITQKILQELIKRNKNLPPSEIVKITNMSGCSS